MQISGKRGCKIEGAGRELWSAQTFPQTAPPLLALQTQVPSQKEPLIGMTNGDFKEESVPDQYAIHSTWITPAFSNLFSFKSNEQTKDKYIAMGMLWVGGVRQVGKQALIRDN